MITIKISNKDLRLIEKAYYEYTASINILSYLLKQKNINQEYIKKYTKQSELYFIILEEYKNTISKKYYPNDNNNYKYSFSFTNETINYFLPEEKNA